MKPTKSSRSALLFTAASLAACCISYSQPTVEVDPGAAIPGTHTTAFATEWNTNGSTESWTATNLALANLTPTSGVLTGTSSSADAQLSRGSLSIATPSDTIVEFRLQRQAADTSQIVLFWDDSVGGFGGPRASAIPGASIPTDGNFHTYRITFSGQIVRSLDAIRIDPTENTTGRVVSMDYFRIHTQPATVLSWAPTGTAGTPLGGTGAWDTTSTFWTPGSTQVAWPTTSGVGGNDATFAGAINPSTVTIAAGGVTASVLNFTSTGYTVSGGPLTLNGFTSLRSPGVTTRINSQLISSVPIFIEGSSGRVVLGADNSTTLTGAVTATCNNIGITHNSALGTGTYTARNPFISALDGDRTIANNVVFALNRVIVDSDALGTGLTVGNLTINGTLALNLAAPGDLFLRRNLTVNGVVSGNNTSNGLFLDGDSGTLTLTNAGNTFTGGLRWRNSSVVAASSDGALGNSANSLNMNGVGSNPTLRLLAAFNSARNIVIDSRGTGATGASTTTGRIDTNGFDSTWTGTISAPVFSTPAVAQQNTGFAKLGAGILTLNPGVSDNNLRSGGILVSGGTLRIASGTFSTGSANSGVNGGSLLEVNGGSLATGNFGVGNSAGTGTFTLNTGGTYTNGAEFLISFGGDGVCNINGGLADLNQFSMVNAAPNTSTMNLNGGEVRLNFFNARANAVTPATAIINFNGSLVRAKSTNADFIETDSTTVVTANVQAGGAIFNTRNLANTTSYNITIKQPLLHDPALGATLDGGLTKNGLGTLTLAPVAGPNTYTGPTTVNAGILAVNGTAIADTGSLVINGGQVQPTGTETVDTMFFGSIQVGSGTYGATGSGATNIDNVRFSGTGVISVTTGPTNTGLFNNWANGTFTPPLTQKLPGDNQDGDSLTNLQEYAFGTFPTVSTGEIVLSEAVVTTPGAPKVVAAAGNYSMVFGRRANYVAEGLTYTVQFSAGLSIWADNDDLSNPPVQIATDGTINAMSVPFPDFIVTPSGVQKPTFSRVGVTLAP